MNMKIIKIFIWKNKRIINSHYSSFIVYNLQMKEQLICNEIRKSLIKNDMFFK